MTKRIKCLFVHDFKFVQRSQDIYGDGQFEYNNLWKNKYLNIFSNVTVVARGSAASDEYSTKGKYKLSGPGMKFVSTESLASLRGLLSLPRLKRTLKREIEGNDVAVVRLPSLQGAIACFILHKMKNKIYIIESVGDAFNALWYHGGIIAKLMAPIMHIITKICIRRADNVIYVTKDYLQKRYPNHHNNIGCSDVIINTFDDSVVDERIRRVRKYNENTTYKIGLVGSYDVFYKGHDVAIKSIAAINHKVELHLLGSGDKSRLVRLAKKYGVSDSVFFDKPVNSGNEMFRWIDSLDILFMPSKTEGMPRVLAEAMSRGVPVIASAAGDISNVLDCEYVIKNNSWRQFAKLTNVLIEDKNAIARAAMDNYGRSHEFNLEELQSQRNNFLREIINSRKIN